MGKIEFEDILKQVGDYGWFQKRLVYFFLIPITVIFSMLCMNTFFMLSEPDHWCTVPNVRVQNLTPYEQHILTRKPIEGTNKFDHCSYYDHNYDVEIERLNEYKKQHNTSVGFKPNVNPHYTTKCSAWTFDHTSYDSNAVIDLNLVCDKSHWRSLIQTIHGIGEVVGNPLFGLLADVFGRHSILFTVITFTLLSSFSPIFYTGLIVFTVCRFLNSATSASIFTLPYILVTELIGPDQRTSIIGLAACCWTLGICILPGVAYLTRDWVLMTLIPCLAALPLYSMWKVVPESPRWLLSKGRYQDAYDVMANIAIVNGRDVPADLMQQLVSLNREKTAKSNRSPSISSAVLTNKSGAVTSVDTVTPGAASFMAIFQYPGLRRKFFLMLFCWTANVCAYRGLTLNFENFHGNEFINWFLLSVVEFPSNLGSWALMETRLGRRWTSTLSMLTGGIVLCLPVFMPSSLEYSIIYVSLVGKFLTNMAYNVTYQQTVELFPTPIRNQAMSYTTAFGAGANFALPYLVALVSTD